ncbi:uncharacterized protein V6R79_014762 [Siganus canaliculatus]
MEDHSSSWNLSNSSVDYGSSSVLDRLSLVGSVVDYILVSSGIPLCAVAVYAVYSMVRLDGPALVYVINLLFSDVLQICSLIVTLTPFHHLWNVLFGHVYIFCLLTSVAFMACIALKRYLLIAWPMWFHSKRPARTSMVVSVLVWILCAVISIVFVFLEPELMLTIFSVVSLLPVPLFLFCLGGTLRALCACQLPADEKWRIMAILVLVLLIHSLLFLPVVVTVLAGSGVASSDLPFILLRVNPLADVVLYVVMRKEAVEKLLTVCCCRLNGGDRWR